jgi:hypothetical protein
MSSVLLGVCVGVGLAVGVPVAVAVGAGCVGMVVDVVVGGTVVVGTSAFEL